MKKVAIVQSNYIPWKGYFDLIRAVDEFILYEDAQYTVRDWRNRNRIKTDRGPAWLTIPVLVKDKRFQALKDVKISDADWGNKHWQAVKRAYGKAAFFKEYRDIFEPLYRNNSNVFLSQVNRRWIEAVNGILSIKTKISSSMEYPLKKNLDKTEKLVTICQKAGASEYFSGPAAKDYLRADLFEKAGIRVHFVKYAGYPEYPQLFLPFVHEVSILDLIFNTGDQATKYMKRFC